MGLSYKESTVDCLISMCENINFPQYRSATHITSVNGTGPCRQYWVGPGQRAVLIFTN